MGHYKKIDQSFCLRCKHYHFKSSSRNKSIVAIDHEGIAKDKSACSEIHSFSEELEVLLEIDPRH